MEKLGELLLREEKLSEEKLQRALEKQKENGKRLGEVLLAEGMIDEESLARAISEQLSIPFVTAEDLIKIDKEALEYIPEFFAREYHCLAFARGEGQLHVVMVDPEDIIVIDNLQKITSQHIVVHIGVQKVIDEAIERHYKEHRATGEVTEALSGLDFVVSTEGAELDDIDINKLKKELDDAPIVKLVNLIISDAIKGRATDIHIEPLFDALLVRYRIDGALQEVMTAPIKSATAIISRIKVMSNLNIAERRLPQDGRISIKSPDREVDVRVSIIPTVKGEKAVLRLLDKKGFEFNLGNLGFDNDMLEIFRKWILMPYGMVIVSGPTGCGKSTTLHAALKEIQNEEDNIVTVEDPVEYQLDKINQLAVADSIGLTFASSLRSILRQDPDKVLIGEIRDKETSDIAIKFALTGHLVFTTLHANDAPSTITRLLDIGVPRYLAGSVTNLVMAQRLVRTICEGCKEEYEPDHEILQILNMDLDKYKDATFYKGKGCVRCRNTGFFGRTALFELLEMKRPIRKVIFDGGNEDDLRIAAREINMVTLRDAGIRKILAGVVSAEEVARKTVEED
ncbi:MAG: Flp pilus assembly complex ATPase component TadA [Candidatus Zixiibacteriota bacterium]|nr:MAG: Flp pilus assembly complex ATPase component TadA [candidate division Zixibacteria bacterium]